MSRSFARYSRHHNFIHKQSVSSNELSAGDTRRQLPRFCIKTTFTSSRPFCGEFIQTAQMNGFPSLGPAVSDTSNRKINLQRKKPIFRRLMKHFSAWKSYIVDDWNRIFLVAIFQKTCYSFTDYLLVKVKGPTTSEIRWTDVLKSDLKSSLKSL